MLSTESLSLSISSDIDVTQENSVSSIDVQNVSISADRDSTEGITNFNFEDLISADNLELLDLDRYEGSIALFDGDSNPVETIKIEDLGDLDLQEIDFNLDDVNSFKINLSSATDVATDSTKTDTYSNLYVFGDSLVDTGNLFNATTAAVEASELLGLDLPVVPPTPPYFEGRFSDGELWIDNLADELDIDLTPATELSVASPGSNVLSPVTLR